MRRKVAIEIFAPIEGVHTELAPSMITPRSSPNVQDCNAFFGVVQKEYGTSLLSSSANAVLAAPINNYFEALFPDNTLLLAFTHTNMAKFASSTFANDGQTYTGTFTDYWSACMHNNEMWFTNGVDLLQYKAAHNSTGTDEAGAVAADSYKAFAVQSFKEHLNLYHTVEGGTENYKRVRWTQVGLLGHTSTDWTNTGAGFLDLQGGEGELLTAAKLGDGEVMVYFEGSMHSQRWVGGTEIYRFDKVFSNLDIPTKRCLAVNDSTHYILMRDGVYEYTGGSNLAKISGAIDEIFTTQVDATNMNYAFMQFIRDVGELRVYLPYTSDTHPTKCWVCKVNAGYAWFRSNRSYTAHGKTTRPYSLTIGDLVGNIGAQDWKFGDMSVSAGAPTYVLGDQSGRTVKIDRSLYSISESGTSTPQSFIFDTKDLTSINDVDPLVRSRYNLPKYMDHESRWVKGFAEIKGEGSAALQYSVDAGNSWTAFPEGAKTLTGDWTLHEWDVDIANPQMRLRLSNTGTNESIHMRYMKVEFVPGGEV